MEESGEAYSLCADDFADEPLSEGAVDRLGSADSTPRDSVEASRQQQRPVPLPPRVEYSPEELERYMGKPVFAVLANGRARVFPSAKGRC